MDYRVDSILRIEFNLSADRFTLMRNSCGEEHFDEHASQYSRTASWDDLVEKMGRSYRVDRCHRRCVMDD